MKRDYSGYEYRLAAVWPKAMGRRDKRWQTTTDLSKVNKQRGSLLADLANGRGPYYADADIFIEVRKVSPWEPLLEETV